jgi:prevent-host-death family protein
VPVITVNLKDADGHLGELIKEVAAGQDVVITSAGGPTVRLMLVPQQERVEPEASRPPKAVGPALDRFIGTWSAEQEAEVLKAVEIFEQVDEAFWR